MLLSLDTSLSSTGYAIFNDEGELIKYGRVQTEKKDYPTEDIRINTMCNMIEYIIIEYNIDKIVCEDQFTSVNAKTILLLRKLVGAIMRTANKFGIDVEYYYPQTWRRHLGINKGKSKEKKLLAYEYVTSQGIDIGEFKPTGVNKNDDIADAICIGFAYLKVKNK